MITKAHQSHLNAAIFLLLVGIPSAFGEDKTDWGNLSGKIQFVGAVPKRKLVKPTKNLTFFKKPLLDESLKVNSEDRGIADVLVWIRPLKGQIVSVHPSYGATAAQDVPLGLRNGRFETARRVVAHLPATRSNFQRPGRLQSQDRPVSQSPVFSSGTRGQDCEAEIRTRGAIPVSNLLQYSPLDARVVVDKRTAVHGEDRCQRAIYHLQFAGRRV